MKIEGIRVFIPSKDYEMSKSFYESLGFSSQKAGDELTIFTKGECSFFLQKYYNEEFAKNLMLQLVVPNIEEAYALISELKFSTVRHTEIKQEAWGKVVYLWGPSGELWHITELDS
ncbi:MAG: VOC family protein [Methylophilaceae bacterium]